MRVLVTGGAGFIGSRVSQAYLARGDDVIVVDDLSSGLADRLPSSAELILADVADPGVAAVIAEARPDLVVHAAAQVSVVRSVVDPALDASINVDGTANVLDGARRAGAARFVFLSSGGAIYGESTGADETSVIAPQSPYGMNKRRAELAVEASGLSHAIARLSNVYGPGQRSDLEGGVVAVFAESLAARRPITLHGSGDQVRDFLYVDDAVAALLLLGDATLSGTWNVSSSRPTTITGLLALLEGLIAPAVEIQRTPARPGDVSHSLLRTDRIRRELGWQPAFNLADGVAAMLGARVAAGG